MGEIIPFDDVSATPDWIRRRRGELSDFLDFLNNGPKDDGDDDDAGAILGLGGFPPIDRVWHNAKTNCLCPQREIGNMIKTKGNTEPYSI